MSVPQCPCERGPIKEDPAPLPRNTALTYACAMCGEEVCEKCFDESYDVDDGIPYQICLLCRKDYAPCVDCGKLTANSTGETPIGNLCLEHQDSRERARRYDER